MRFMIVSTGHRVRRAGTRDVVKPLTGDPSDQWIFREDVGAFVYRGGELDEEEFAKVMADDKKLDRFAQTLGGVSCAVNRSYWKVLVVKPKPEPAKKGRGKAEAAAEAVEGL